MSNMDKSLIKKLRGEPHQFEVKYVRKSLTGGGHYLIQVSEDCDRIGLIENGLVTIVYGPSVLGNFPRTAIQFEQALELRASLEAMGMRYNEETPVDYTKPLQNCPAFMMASDERRGVSRGELINWISQQGNQYLEKLKEAVKGK